MLKKIINFLLLGALLINNTHTKENCLIAKKDNQEIALIYKFLLPKKSERSEQDAWTQFHKSIFEFKETLKYAVENKLTVILVVPENIEISQLSEVAPWVEGARVAMSWASAFYRFSKLPNTDIRMLKVNESVDDFEINNLIKKLLLLNIKDDQNLSPEKRINNRIFSTNDINNFSIDDFVKNNISLEKFIFNLKKDTKNITISPKFSSIENNKKRIVVSGAAGFLGSFIVTELINDGHQVIGLDSLICGSTENLKDIMNDKNFEFYNVDITIPLEIEGKIDYIVHLASVPSPEFYYNLPVETLTSGLDGTKNFLELALKKNARFLFSSTSEVYGDPLISPQTEDYPGNVNPFGKRSQYDQSKRGGETLIKLYFDKYKLDVRIARIFNTYGPNMDINDGRVVTNFCKSILENKPLKIYGDGNQTRSFAYVSDTVNGMLKLLFNEKITDTTKILDRVFNIGSDQEFTINELANKISFVAKESLKKDVKILFEKQIDDTDPKQRRPDLKRANQILDYYPKIELIDGLRKTLTYFCKKLNCLK